MFNKLTFALFLAPCSSSPCYNNATCIDTIGGHKCICSPGFYGLTCEKSNFIVK